MISLMNGNMSVFVYMFALVIALICSFIVAYPSSEYQSDAVGGSEEINSIELNGTSTINSYEADCNCTGGQCVRDERINKTVCRCKPGQGLMPTTWSKYVSAYECRDCACGENERGKFNCTFDYLFGDVQCLCPAGYSQLRGKCEDCKCGENLKGKFNCTYFSHSSGDHKSCACPTGYSKDYYFRKCRAIDPCDENPCQNEGICIKKGRFNYECHCTGNYTGDNCEIEIKPCVPNPCQHEGICISQGDNNYACYCKNGYVGETCEIELRPCLSNPCLNGGLCVDSGEDYACLCKRYYTGPVCESVLHDDCSTSPCRNGGTCTELANSYSCSCSKWYSGKNCEYDKWCTHGPGRFLCWNCACSFNHWTEAGTCECTGNNSWLRVTYPKQQYGRPTLT